MSSGIFARESYDIAARLIRERTIHLPNVGLILGSGMGEFADAVSDPVIIETHDIPGWPQSTVEGHKGRVLIGALEGQMVCVLQGRIHFYEGYTAQQITFPVRVMQALGVKTLIVTNAAGGLNTGFTAGDLMPINDHINLTGLAGQHPLIGPNDSALGTRFPDMTIAYDLELRALAHRVADAEGVTLRDGVYVAISGPSFETPAEVRMLRAWGADAVGMSTASEVTVARHGGMRVMGISGISNINIDHNDPNRKTTHEEVMDIGQTRIVPALTKLLRGVLRELPNGA